MAKIQMWILLVPLGLGIAAYVLWNLHHPAHTYRYKLTVEVMTPEGKRIGSAVREVRWRDGARLTTELNLASLKHRGEAVMVDLPGDRVLFALLPITGHETAQLAFGSARQTRNSDRSVRVLAAPLRPEPVERQGGYPVFATFDDLDEPASVKHVDRADLAATFGPGTDLLRVTAQITDEPITLRVEERLPWLGEYYDRKFDGRRYTTLDASNRFANSLSSGAFRAGLARPT